MNNESTHQISERIGRGLEVSDQEFFAFMSGEDRFFVPWPRRVLVRALLRGKPWQAEIKRHLEAESSLDQFLADRPHLADPTRLTPPPWMDVATETRLASGQSSDAQFISRNVARCFQYVALANQWFAVARSGGKGLELVAPVNQVVSSVNPVFEWHIADESVAVIEVSIYLGDDVSGTLVDSSRRPVSNSWRFSRSLAPSDQYTWTVTYQHKGLIRTETARFITLGEEAARYLSGETDGLTTVDEAIILIELQRYERAAILLHLIAQTLPSSSEERTIVDELLLLIKGETAISDGKEETKD